MPDMLKPFAALPCVDHRQPQLTPCTKQSSIALSVGLQHNFRHAGIHPGFLGAQTHVFLSSLSPLKRCLEVVSPFLHVCPSSLI